MTSNYEVDTEYSAVTEKPDFWNDVYGDLDFDTAMSVAEPVLMDMGRDLDGGQGWAETTDITRVFTCADEDFDTWMSDSSYSKDKSQLTITFPSEELAVLWVAEIVGQISDGVWSQDLSERQWAPLCYADIRVDSAAESVTYDNGWPESLDYSGRLTEMDGQEERMIFFVRASGVDPEYGYDDLESDLESLDTMRSAPSPSV